MRINDSFQRYLPFLPTIRQDENDYRVNPQKERSFFFNNSNICQYYGQSNIEKCIFILFFIITFTSTLLYHFFSLMNTFLFYAITTTLIADAISLVLYSFFLYRLRSENMFDNIPAQAIRMNDFLIVFNSIGKSLVLVLVTLNFLGWVPFAFFAGKYLIEVYFMMIAVKLFMFCPGARFVQEQSEKFWNFVRFYIFCCEVEQEQEYNEYTRLEEIESFY